MYCKKSLWGTASADPEHDFHFNGSSLVVRTTMLLNNNMLYEKLYYLHSTVLYIYIDFVLKFEIDVEKNIISQSRLLMKNDLK